MFVQKQTAQRLLPDDYMKADTFDYSKLSAFVSMDFSLFKTITQRVSVLNNNPPAMRVETICYTKKSPIRYNIVVQATIVRKDGDFNG